MFSELTSAFKLTTSSSLAFSDWVRLSQALVPPSQARESVALPDAISSTAPLVFCVAVPRAVCRRMFLIA